jgi:hypothetical protein
MFDGGGGGGGGEDDTSTIDPPKSPILLLATVALATWTDPLFKDRLTTILFADHSIS